MITRKKMNQEGIKMSVLGAQGNSGMSFNMLKLMREEQAKIDEQKQNDNSSATRDANKNQDSVSVSSVHKISVSIDLRIELSGYGSDRLRQAVPDEMDKLMKSFQQALSEGLEGLKPGQGTTQIQSMVTSFREQIENNLEDFRLQEQPEPKDLGQSLRESFLNMKKNLFDYLVPDTQAQPAQNLTNNTKETNQNPDDQPAAEKSNLLDYLVEEEINALLGENYSTGPQQDWPAFLQNLEGNFEQGLTIFVSSLEQVSQGTDQTLTRQKAVASYTRYSQGNIDT